MARPVGFSSPNPASMVVLLQVFLLFSAINPAIGTYSIIAFNRTSGAVGCAVTSCIGSLSALVVCRAAAERGVVAAQAQIGIRGRDEALGMLQSGDFTAGEIVSEITSSTFDPDAVVRQYGVCTASGCATFTGDFVADCYGRTELSSCYAGFKIVDSEGLDTISSYQGNVLTSEQVLIQSMSGFAAGLTNNNTHGHSLAARLMAALKAGTENGEGDVRCRDDKGTASDSAALMVLSPAGSGEQNMTLEVSGTMSQEAVDELLEMFEGGTSPYAPSSASFITTSAPTLISVVAYTIFGVIYV
eukprot:CAMPEP_0171308814 /NCGR_PEP_ID=MMETSP0816-20121228/18932_1 /TAXON_ID=420281 /ORGANISM="Proboscia inermis, Strain CCAP1064/1" /LENGTH=300 /DNA_ID=CAMNT_0011791947 /DNA_START=70 /DNA_END=972 /DNA_ORIENTATION=+